MFEAFPILFLSSKVVLMLYYSFPHSDILYILAVKRYIIYSLLGSLLSSNGINVILI